MISIHKCCKGKSAMHRCLSSLDCAFLVLVIILNHFIGAFDTIMGFMRNWVGFQGIVTLSLKKSFVAEASG